MMVQKERSRGRHSGVIDPKEEDCSEKEGLAAFGLKASSYLRRQMAQKDPTPASARKGASTALWEQFNESLPKVAVVGLLLVSVVILVLVKNRGDAAALFCVRSSSALSSLPAAAPIAFPAVDFKRVKRIVDTSKFGVIRAEKWIVLSTASRQPAIEQIRVLIKIRGWQVVVVADSDASAADWDIRGAIFLSMEQQAALGYRILAHLPYASDVRKAVGYLFAIHHGAKIIYDGDASASVLTTGGGLDKAFELELSAPLPLLQYPPLPNRTCVNPYAHFGQRSVWPRGLPLEHVGQISPESMYGQVSGGKQYIQQGLANGLPDVDSLFYHTRKSGTEEFDITFDSLAPPVALPQGTMAPVNSLNTLFHYPAFWGLMLPVSISSKASDIFRGYWAQRLLWEIRGYLSIYPPSIHRPDNMEPPSFMDEEDLHNDIGKLIDFLVSWRSKKKTLFKKILHLSHSLAEAGFWAVQDVTYTVDWLQDLISVGYLQPKLLSLELDHSPSRLHYQEFVPLRLLSMHLGVEEASSVSFEIGNLLKWRKFYGNIVLILHCSWPANHTALGWKALYGRIFKNVVLLSEQSNMDFQIESTDSSQPYKALPKIFERFSNAEGFLFMKDEVILNYWNLLEADKNKLWNLHKVNDAWKVVNYNEKGSEWYHSTSLKKDMQALLSSLPVHFRIAHGENIDAEHFVVGNSDIFYVPQRFVADFVDLVDSSAEAELRQEVAIPLFFLCMDSMDNFDELALSKVVYNTNPSSFYTADAHAVFPWSVRSELDIMRVMKVMSTSDPLLQEVL